MSTYLLEVGLEEVPARFMPALLSELKTRWEAALSAHRIDFETVETVGTYRRLATLIHGIAAQSRPDKTRIRGPITSIAMGPDSKLTPAGLGFLKKNNLSDYTIETEGNKDHIVGYVDHPARPVTELLGPIAESVTLGISLPIAMTWGTGIGPYIRPIHWVASLLDTSAIPVQFFDIASEPTTRGHRFLGSTGATSIPSATHYVDTLARESVIVRPLDRRAIILSALETQMGPTGPWDAELVEEVVFLTEFPSPLVCEIDSTYMGLPQDAIIECIQKNQKYFPVIRDGKLTSQYVIIADSVTPTNATTIRSGNHSVLRARLEDVKFFWEEDIKHSLEANTEKLKSIVYQKGLGSVWDKVQRIEAIATSLAPILGITTLPDLRRAALLCKADLVSQMVLEMPKLQGIMGRIYAQRTHESPDVATAIGNLYVPEIVTDHPLSTAIAMADRLDTIVSCFANKLIPTGSQDPWGVRRAALGVVRAARDLHLPISLAELVDIGYTALGKTDSREACIQFMHDRLVYILECDDARSDLIQCVLQSTNPTIAHILNTLTQFEYQKHEPQFKGLVETGIRIKRLGSTASDIDFNPALLTPDEHTILLPILSLIDTPIQDLGGLNPIATTMPLFFEKILVMDPDLSVRNNRLGMLKHLHSKFAFFGNFEKIVIE